MLFDTDKNYLIAGDDLHLLLSVQKRLADETTLKIGEKFELAKRLYLFTDRLIVQEEA